MASLGLVFCVGFVSFDQWMTPDITPFVTGLVAAGMVVYWTPSISIWVFSAIYGLFFYAIGLTQSNPEILLSNRINGLVAVVVGWILSVVLWRNFITVTLQRMQLEAANAELQAKQKELQRLTRLDGLTGLYNRNTFVDLTRQELARAQRQGSATTILLLDLDFFKHVNDTWGHPAGDAVLKNVATVANASVRATDLVGRLGGEEFIILLPNTTLEAAKRLAEKLRINLERSPTPWEKLSIACTVSIGVASTTAAENRDFDHLYTSADKALYTAKEKGRNRVE
jgi:diguanylate cyclase (GGDEF)-like protein